MKPPPLRYSLTSGYIPVKYRQAKPIYALPKPKKPKPDAKRMEMVRDGLRDDVF